MGANLILFNGNIYTLNPAQPRAQALVARDEKIVYVGDDAGARELLAARAHAIDLKGACAIPGLADAHVHLRWLAQGLQAVNVETPTLDEALAHVAQRAACRPAGEWVSGHGWNHNVWGNHPSFVKGFPTAAHLDRVAPAHPVALSAKSGHALWVNSRALELAGITPQTPDPPGGQILRALGGTPSGVLLEAAAELVKKCIPKLPLDELVEALRPALQLANRTGLSSVHDFDDPQVLSALQVLRTQGELTLRLSKGIPFAHLDSAVALGLRTGLGDDWIRIGHVKLFADGALGARTALMLEGYESAPNELGIAATPLEDIRQAVDRASSAGLACAIHAIGDKANRQVLDVYQEEGFRFQVSSFKLRHRIEHVQLLHPDDVGRLAELGVIASMQPVHATSDMLVAEEHWGSRRCAGAYALRALLERGTKLAFGSDCPVESLDPLAGIHAAVTRRRADGTPGPAGWHPEQRLSVAQAVRGFTWGPAYAAGLEDRLGTLEVGKLADVTILDRDIFAIEPIDILATRVVGTLVGGRFAWLDENRLT
jgi:predicted amidohydrolase YtcJ